MSIKLRITMWFTLMLLLLAAMVLVFLLVINGSAITNDPAGRLVELVYQNANDVEFERGRLEWEDLDACKNGVYLSYYDNAGQQLHGAVPVSGGFTLPFEAGVVRLERADGVDYYVYDTYLDMDFTGLWIRGAVAASSRSGVMRTILTLTAAILPGLLLLSIGGGWLIAWGAFRPMEKMIAAVDSITGGDDLSRRIALRRGPSEMRKLSRTFDGMLQRLETSFQAEKQFTADASHELRTPVAVILAQCENARRKERTQAEYLSALAAIEEQGQRMSELIQELLSITRLEQGTDKYPLRRQELSAALAAWCEEFVPTQARGITCVTDIAPGLAADFNPLLLSRAVWNLLENAYRYGKEGGWVRVSLHARGDGALLLQVADNGVGIAPAEQEKIWQRFWQADTARGGGSGLGLAMVREIARYHAGDATVESAPGEGSIFTLTLPEKKIEKT